MHSIEDWPTHNVLRRRIRVHLQTRTSFPYNRHKKSNSLMRRSGTTNCQPIDQPRKTPGRLGTRTGRRTTLPIDNNSLLLICDGRPPADDVQERGVLAKFGSIQESTRHGSRVADLGFDFLDKLFERLEAWGGRSRVTVSRISRLCMQHAFKSIRFPTPAGFVTERSRLAQHTAKQAGGPLLVACIYLFNLEAAMSRPAANKKSPVLSKIAYHAASRPCYITHHYSHGFRFDPRLCLNHRPGSLCTDSTRRDLCE